MLKDILLQVATAQAITVDTPLLGIIDLEDLALARHIGTGEPMCFAISVAVAADHTSGTETYTFILQQSDNADLSSADSILQRTIDYTDLALGHLEYIPIPPGWPRKRYLGIYADVSASDTPTVTLNCWLTLQSMIEDRQYFHTASAIL